VEQFMQVVPRYMERHKEKAGLTGWAQINGLRGDTSIAERTRFDLYYIENWSLWLDLKIMFKTIPHLLKDDHAY
jgi:lipopolysaccharide/colanic/teichoic acid biosynthesis glycosyltransferase